MQIKQYTHLCYPFQFESKSSLSNFTLFSASSPMMMMRCIYKKYWSAPSADHSVLSLKCDNCISDRHINMRRSFKHSGEDTRLRNMRECKLRCVLIESGVYLVYACVSLVCVVTDGYKVVISVF